MRFNEFASDTVGDVLSILKLMIKKAAARNSSGKISYDELLQILNDAKIPFGGPYSDMAEMLAALQAAVPGIEKLIEPTGSDGTTTLNQPNEPGEVQSKAKGPGIEKMAKGNLELSPKI